MTSRNRTPLREDGAVASDDYAAARGFALRALSKREHTRRELRLKLKARGFAAGLIQSLIQNLAAEGLQSDVRYAAQFARLASERRGRAPARIVRELCLKGVPEALAKEVVAELGAEAERDALREAMRRRLRSIGPPSAENRRRWMDYLRRQGFRVSLILEELGNKGRGN